MKLLILALAAFVCSAGNPAWGIGQACSSSGAFIVTSFVANPYPPSAGIQMTVNMAGTFGQNEFISDISIRSNHNGGTWNYTYVDVNESFTYGQVYTFSFPVTAGTSGGIYNVEVRLERKQGTAVSCWLFTYHI